MNHENQDDIKLKAESAASPPNLLLAYPNTAEAAAALYGWLVTSSVTPADAIFASQQALDTQSSFEKILNSSAATSNIAGLAANSTEMFQKFASASAKAGALAANVAEKAAFVGFFSSALSVAYTTFKYGPDEVTMAQLTGLGAAALGAAAVAAAPVTAVGLGVLAAGLTAYGWTNQANQTKVTALLGQISGIIQDYYHHLSAPDQAAFSTSLKDTMQATLSGGVLVPKVDADGLVYNYAVQVPKLIVTQADGSKLYTFDSGATLHQDAILSSSTGTLSGPAASGRGDVWSIPNATSTTQIVTRDDGSFSNIFRDSKGAIVAETLINGSSGRYDVSTLGYFNFVTAAGNDALIKAGAGSYVDLRGTGNSIDVTNGTVLVRSVGIIHGSSNTILGDARSLITLDGMNHTLTFETNSGSWLNLGGNSSVVINGSGNGIGMWGSGAYAATSNNVVNFSAAGFSTGIKGDGNTINVKDHSWTNISGTNNTVNSAANSDAHIDFGGTNVVGIVNGTGNTIGVLGTGGYFVSSYNAINFSATGFSTGIRGDGNTINVKDHSWTNISGTKNTVNSAANSDAHIDFGGTNVVGVVNGTGNSIGVLGTGGYFVSSFNTVNFSAAGFSTGISGDGNTINVKDHSWTNISGTKNTVNTAANSDAHIDFGGTNVVGIVNGSGNTIGVLGTGGYLVSSYNAINFSAGGFSTGIKGDGNSINVKDYSWTNISGNKNTVNTAPNGGAHVDFEGTNVVGIVNGTGNSIGVLGSGGYFVSSFNTVNFSAAGFSTGITGDGNTINAKDHSWTNISGTNNVINTVSNSGTQVHFGGANVVGTVNGTGNTIGVLGTGDYIVSSYNAINFSAAGFSTTIRGDGNILGLKENSSTNIIGTNTVVNAPSNSSAYVYIGGSNSAATVNGNGNVIGVSDSGQTIRSDGNTIVQTGDGFLTHLTGNKNVFNARAGSVVDVSGSDNTLNLQSNGGAVVNLNGFRTSITVNNGQGNTIGIADNETSVHTGGSIIRFSRSGLTTTVKGNDNVILAEHATLNLSGANNTIGGKNNVINAAPHSTVFVDSPNTTVHGSNLTVIIGEGAKGSKITITGDHNYYATSQSANGSWVKDVHDLQIDVGGDHFFKGPTGVASGIVLYGGEGYQSWMHSTGDSNYGAWMAPAPIFPSYAPPPNASSSGMLNLPSGDRWAYDYSMVYSPINTLPEGFNKGWGSITVGPNPDSFEDTSKFFPHGAETFYYPLNPVYGTRTDPENIDINLAKIVDTKTATLSASTPGTLSYANLIQEPEHDEIFDRFLTSITKAPVDRPAAAPELSTVAQTDAPRASDMLRDEGLTKSAEAPILYLHEEPYYMPECWRHASLS